jgi:hypothetical protein
LLADLHADCPLQALTPSQYTFASSAVAEPTRDTEQQRGSGGNGSA